GARRVALREWVAQGGELWVVPQNASASGERETLNVGLGRVHHALDGFWASATDRAEQRFAPWQKVAPALLTSEDIDAWKLDRPVLALILFLVVFGVLVGPVNIFVFAPPLRRQRLFLTVPLL